MGTNHTKKGEKQRMNVYCIFQDFISENGEKYQILCAIRLDHGQARLYVKELNSHNPKQRYYLETWNAL